jgi:phage tail-like protein
MALAANDIKRRYPLPAYNYRVSILDSIGSTTLLSCSEISGLSMEIETEVYRHGLSFIAGFNIIPAMPKEVRLSIKKGVTQEGKYLSDWMKISYPFTVPLPLSLVRKRDLLIDLCNEDGIPVVRWTVLKAMPVKLDSPSFQADTNEVAFEQLDLIAHELKVDYDP